MVGVAVGATSLFLPMMTGALWFLGSMALPLSTEFLLGSPGFVMYSWNGVVRHDGVSLLPQLSQPSDSSLSSLLLMKVVLRRLAWSTLEVTMRAGVLIVENLASILVGAGVVVDVDHGVVRRGRRDGIARWCAERARPAGRSRCDGACMASGREDSTRWAESIG